MPVRRDGREPPNVLLNVSVPMPPLYELCVVMHALMCASRSDSKEGRLRDGSSRWQTGHSSSSASWCCRRGGSCVAVSAPTCRDLREEEGDTALGDEDDPAMPKSDRYLPATIGL